MPLDPITAHNVTANQTLKQDSSLGFVPKFNSVWVKYVGDLNQLGQMPQR